MQEYKFYDKSPDIYGRKEKTNAETEPQTREIKLNGNESNQKMKYLKTKNKRNGEKKYMKRNNPRIQSINTKTISVLFFFCILKPYLSVC